MEPATIKVPSGNAVYQSAVSPLPTTTERVGIGLPVQYSAFPLLIGTGTTEQRQSGAETGSELAQFWVVVTVNVMLTPEGTALMVQLLLPLSVTVPAVLVTVPVLTVTVRE